MAILSKFWSVAGVRQYSGGECNVFEVLCLCHLVRLLFYSQQWHEYLVKLL